MEVKAKIYITPAYHPVPLPRGGMGHGSKRTDY
jgi:hypothetical protein